MVHAVAGALALSISAARFTVEVMRARVFRIAIVAAALAVPPLMSACGTSSPTAEASPKQTVSPSQSASPLVCSTGGPASASWITPDQVTGSTPPIASAVVSGETLTLTFVQGTPTFEVTPQPTAQFTAVSGRGGTVLLSGTSGVRIVLRGFRGDMQNYSGTQDFIANGKTLVEVRELGDYEGVVGWAAGLSKPGCASVVVGQSTLTFTFIPS
jgi:hypothetical protein